MIDIESLSDLSLLAEYKKCIATLCREEFTNEVNEALSMRKEIEKELLRRMR